MPKHDSDLGPSKEEITFACPRYTNHNVSSHGTGPEDVERKEDLLVMTAQERIASSFCLFESHLK